jgi:RNA polymerase subunit RPABC4/transcription elongation factor Spt4
MPRLQVEPFQKGDRVVKGDERGVVELRKNRATQEWFPVVIITAGPRTAQSEYPRKGWKIELDQPGGTIEERCADCERIFRRNVTVTPKQIFCRQCEAVFDQRERAMSADAETSSRFNDTNWKSEHRPARRRL